MLSDTLKNQTQVNHQKLEKVLVSKLKAMSEVEQYIDILRLFQGYFAALEIKIQKSLNYSMLPDYDQRRKSTALTEDLSSFGMKSVLIATDDDLPEIDNHENALGALYVIEGSTLGGKMIAAMVSRQLDLKGDVGLSFFNGYGYETAAMWSVFKEAINSSDQSADKQAAIIETANQTFSKFYDWMVKNGLSFFKGDIKS